MEKVKLPAFRPRRTDDEIKEQCPWATLGKSANRKPNIITSLELDSYQMERNNIRFQQKFKEIEEKEVLVEEIGCEDAEYILVAFGSAARICQKAIDLAREQGMKVGLVRPITLWPFPTKTIAEYAEKVKGFLTVEMNAGQMVEDVRLAVNGKVKVEHFGRLGGIVPTPNEVVNALKSVVNG
jgi:2-oxoglutarate ferredoxin oxidoreductase subunit alpha